MARVIVRRRVVIATPPDPTTLSIQTAHPAQAEGFPQMPGPHGQEPARPYAGSGRLVRVRMGSRRLVPAGTDDQLEHVAGMVPWVPPDPSPVYEPVRYSAYAPPNRLAHVNYVARPDWWWMGSAHAGTLFPRQAKAFAKGKPSPVAQRRGRLRRRLPKPDQGEC